MKVLLANKFFYPKGGAAVAFFATAKLLENNGHSAVFFSMDDPQNLESPYSGYFVSHVDLNEVQGTLQKLKAAGRILYSLEAKEKISRLIDNEGPDIAHLHNIYHQLSPSIIDALKKRGVPIVMSLHDYKLTCPVYTLLSGGRVCEACREGRYYNAIWGRCVKGSGLKSGLGALEMYLHHKVLNIYDKVDVFILSSRFQMDKVREMGFQGEFVRLPNFVAVGEYTPSYGSGEGGIVYFGRLSHEKGLTTLVEAVKGLDVKLGIIGDGPARRALMAGAEAGGIENVSFPGWLSGARLRDEIRKSMFTVVPSVWYENNPLSIIESFALGKPVIGARIGGIPELVRDWETGLTFEPGNVEDLREKIQTLLKNKEAAVEMGKKARRYVEEELDAERHHEGLMKVYDRALEKKGTSARVP